MGAQQPLDMVSLLVGEGATRALGPSCSLTGESVQTALGIRGPPAADRLATDAEEVGHLGLSEPQFTAMQGAQAEDFQDLIGQLTSNGQGDSHETFLPRTKMKCHHGISVQLSCRGNTGNFAESGIIIVGNSANGITVGGCGGGIYNFSRARVTDSNTARVTDSKFIDNSATVGGGICSAGGTLTVNNSVFSNNSADSGGGIENLGTMTVSDSIFRNNSAGAGGGIVNEYDATMTVANSIFTSNSAIDSDTGVDHGGV